MGETLGALVAGLVLTALATPGTVWSQNGVVSGARETVQPQVAVTPGATWYEFHFGDVGSFASDGDGNCVPSSANNSVSSGDPPWTFAASANGAILTVTDAFQDGDAFEVLDFGVSVGVTSTPGVGQCGDNPDVCLTDPNVSHVPLFMAPGNHEITLRVTASPFTSGCAYFRVKQIGNVLDDYQCWQAKDLKNPKFVKVLGVSLVDQFAAGTVDAVKPFLVCNPASKNGSQIVDPNAHQCCYKIKGAKLKPPVNVAITDQFGSLQLQATKRGLLCQPCTKTIIP
jgi:hypothetical protein